MSYLTIYLLTGELENAWTFGHLRDRPTGRAGRHHRRRFGGFGFGGRTRRRTGRYEPGRYARRADAGAGRPAARRAGADRGSAAARLRNHQAGRGEDRRLVLAEPRHRLSDADLSGRSRLRHRGERGLKKALHHHRRRPRLSRNQSRSRRRGARPSRLRSANASIAGAAPRAANATSGARLPPLVEAAFDHLRETVGKRLEGDADAEASLVEILARTDAELQRRS